MSRRSMGQGIPEWNTPELTEGQFLSEWRRAGRDGEFQAHLLRRHTIIAFHRIARPLCEPIINALTKAPTRGDK